MKRLGFTLVMTLVLLLNSSLTTHEHHAVKASENSSLAEGRDFEVKATSEIILNVHKQGDTGATCNEDEAQPELENSLDSSKQASNKNKTDARRAVEENQANLEEKKDSNKNNTNTEKPPNQDKSNQDDPDQGKSNKENAKDENNTPAQPSEEINKEFIKASLKLGQTKKEVKKIMGDNFNSIVSMKHNESSWRYDIGANENYHFHDEGFDIIDREGIEKRLIKMQIFITWTRDNKIKSLSSYHLNQDNKLHEYRIFPNGEIRDVATSEL
jgi:hypothetical protein